MNMECPFCGIVADEPHQSQEACIAALHAEIDRMRGVIDCLRSVAVPHAAGPLEDQPVFQLAEDEEPQF